MLRAVNYDVRKEKDGKLKCASQRFKGQPASSPASPTKNLLLPSPHVWRGASDSPSVTICAFATVPVLLWQAKCDQRQGLNQVGAGRTWAWTRDKASIRTVLDEHGHGTQSVGQVFHCNAFSFFNPPDVRAQLPAPEVTLNSYKQLFLTNPQILSYRFQNWSSLEK